MNEPNAILAERCRGDDERAFAALVGRYQSLVFGFCMRMLGHRQDAEDATQETFSRVARYLDRWDSRRPLEPWLMAIAGNRCRSFLSRRRPGQPLTPAVEPITDAARADQAADSLREELDLALAQLSGRQRRAFELFHRESLSYAEIAERLECPVGTVKTLVHRARSGLIDRLRSRNVIGGLRKKAPTEPDRHRPDTDPDAGG
jgi:RNA polymerase sigma-70 factor (ECF subfamily)